MRAQAIGPVHDPAKKGDRTIDPTYSLAQRWGSAFGRSVVHMPIRRFNRRRAVYWPIGLAHNARSPLVDLARHAHNMLV